MESILWSRGKNQSFGAVSPGNRERNRKHENNRRQRRAIRVVTARHAALGHGGHVVTAIHRMLWGNWQVLRVVALYRALARRAARGGVEQPGSSAQWRVKRRDGDEAKCSEKGTKTILWPRTHANPKLSSMIRLKTIRRQHASPSFKKSETTET